MLGKNSTKYIINPRVSRYLNTWKEAPRKEGGGHTPNSQRQNLLSWEHFQTLPYATPHLAVYMNLLKYVLTISR